MSQQTKTHLFGEMDLNFYEPANKVYKTAFDIGESCGYMVEAHADHIDILGEDCPDQFYIINRLQIKDKMINKAFKLVYRYDNKKLVKSYELINNEWKESK